MFDTLTTAGDQWKTALGGLDADSMVGRQPEKALAVLREVERATAAARLAVTARAEEMHPWQREGYSSFEHWLAAQEGTSTGQARRAARTARKVKDRPKTRQALADGDISEDEADVIADASDKNPRAEDDLLDTAKHKSRSHDDLKDRAAKAKAAGEDDQARARRLRAGRQAGWGRDRDGFWAIFGKLEPHIGADLAARLDAEVDRRFKQARTDGDREPKDRYKADALAALILGRPAGTPVESDPAEPGPDEGDDQPDQPDPGRASRPRAGTVVHKYLHLDTDLAAYRRGHTLSGETCQIRGIGPVPVEIARQWADDAFITAVIRDGTDIKTVAHFGRHIPAPVRTAL
ncbi:MAG: DUF222 domain-containing protein, partial [Actinomycetota bacterium]